MFEPMKKLMMLLFLVSCSEPKENKFEKPIIEEVKKELPSLYIKTNTYTTAGKNYDRHQSFDTISVVSLDYFEVNLYPNGKTETTVKEPDISLDSTSSIYFKITTKEGKDIIFNNTTEFLNHVSKSGYELKDQIRKKRYTTYTFKKI
jgi:hypothetical protein